MAARLERYAIWVVLLGLLAVAAALSPHFLNPVYLLNLVRQASPAGIVSVGVTLVMVLGGVDLSVGAIMSLAAVLAAGWMAGENGNILPAVLGTVAVGMAIGLVNGLLLSRRTIPPLILTLGMATVVQGLNLLYTRGTAYGAVAPAFRSFVNQRIGVVPVLVLIFAGLAALGAVLLRTTPFGRMVYLVGGNAEAARLAGIPVARVTVLAYVLSGAFAALAGLALLGRSGVSSNFAGQGFEFDALSAVVLGGTTFEGGRGGVGGTIAGVLVLFLSFNLVNLLGLSYHAQLIGKGLIIVGATSLYALIRRS